MADPVLCPRCRSRRVYRVGPYWICFSLSCDLLVVKQ